MTPGLLGSPPLEWPRRLVLKPGVVIFGILLLALPSRGAIRPVPLGQIDEAGKPRVSILTSPGYPLLIASQTEKTNPPPVLQQVAIPPAPENDVSRVQPLPQPPQHEGTGGDYGLGPFGRDLEPGTLDFFGWNSPPSRKLAAVDAAPIARAPALHQQPLVILESRITVARKGEDGAGITLQPAIRLRNLGSQIVARLWFAFRNKADDIRFFTAPVEVVIAPETDAAVNGDVEFHFARFPAELSALELVVARVDFTDGGNWASSPYAGWPSDADTPPRPMRIPQVQYTDSAVQHHTSGWVTMKVFVEASGRAGWVTIYQGLPWGLNENAVRAALNTTFEPATKDGRPVARWTDFAVQFAGPRINQIGPTVLHTSEQANRPVCVRGGVSIQLL